MFLDRIADNRYFPDPLRQEAGNVLDEAAIPRSLGPGDTQRLPDRVRTLYRFYVQEMARRRELEALRDVHVPDFPPNPEESKP